jgi:hypothetical protein
LSGALNGLAKLVWHKVAPRREEAMVKTILTSGRNVVDFATYQQARKAAAAAPALRGPLCRHCGAVLGEDEREDECSGAGFNFESPRLRETLRKFVAE